MVMFSFFVTHSISPFIEHHYTKFGFNPILYRENQAKLQSREKHQAIVQFTFNSTSQKVLSSFGD